MLDLTRLHTFTYNPFSRPSWVPEHLYLGAQPKIQRHWATEPHLVFFSVQYNTMVLYFTTEDPLTALCLIQGSHRLEKLEGFLEKSLKIKSALKVLESHSKALKSP